MRLPSFLVSILNQYGDFLPRWAASTIVSLIVSGLLSLGFGVDEDTAGKFSLLLTVAFAGAWGEYLKKQGEAGVKQIQAAIQPIAPEVDVDGRAKPGGITVAAISRAANVLGDIEAGAIASTETKRQVTQALKP